MNNEFLDTIRSLSQNLLQIVDQDHLETEDFEDIKSSISTIINESIFFFVENYRKLAASYNKQNHQFYFLKIVLNDVALF
jgi:hypothetical protein